MFRQNLRQSFDKFRHYSTIEIRRFKSFKFRIDKRSNIQTLNPLKSEFRA
jgi:hypothetical protein